MEGARFQSHCDIIFPHRGCAILARFSALRSEVTWPWEIRIYFQSFIYLIIRHRNSNFILPTGNTTILIQATTVLAALNFYQDKEKPSNEIEFPYIELAAKMGWDPFIARRELRDLDKRAIPGFKLGVLVEFKDLSFHVHAPGDLSDEEMDEVSYVFQY